MEPIISVIMPVYNSRKSLRQAIDCILGQSFGDFELLLIDDGSTDGSDVLCDEAAASDSRIRVWHQANAGVAAARNVGLAQARGRYVIHADADDIIEPDMLGQMYRTACSEKADIVFCDFYWDENHRRIQRPEHPDADSIVRDILCGRIQGSLWNKLIRRELYEQNHIRFFPDINYCEDLLVVVMLLRVASRIVYLPEAFYHYMSNPDSITRKISRETFRQRVLFIGRLREILPASFDDAVWQNILYIKYDAYRSRLFTLREQTRLFPGGGLAPFRSGFRRRMKFLLFFLSYRQVWLARLLVRQRDFE